MKQLLLWDNDSLLSPDSLGAEARNASSNELADVALPPVADFEPTASHAVSGPPTPPPLISAIEAGVFGQSLDGPIAPDEEQVAALTAEHVNEMIILLADGQAVEDALRLRADPVTGRVPSTREGKQALLSRLRAERKRLFRAYDEALAAYAEGFGDIAAQALDEWTRKTVPHGEKKKEPYPPTHPWHYFHAGDNAKPIPLDQIEPDSSAGRWLEERFPKSKAKRLDAVRQMLEREEASLSADRQRYADIVTRGAEALSRFDREIAHTSDAMAVATALALKYTHVSLGLGRVAWLTGELRRLEPDFPLLKATRPDRRASRRSRTRTP